MHHIPPHVVRRCPVSYLHVGRCREFGEQGVVDDDVNVIVILRDSSRVEGAIDSRAELRKD